MCPTSTLAGILYSGHLILHMTELRVKCPLEYLGVCWPTAHVPLFYDHDPYSYKPNFSLKLLVYLLYITTIIVFGDY